MSQVMTLDTRRVPQGMVVRLAGRFDAQGAEEVKKSLQLLAEATTNRLVIEMSEVPFIDSAGLAVLVSVLKRVRKAGGSVSLCGVQPQAHTVFTLTMLDQVFPIFASVEEALGERGRTADDVQSALN